MAVATASDVAARLGRPLDTEETAKATAYLADVEAEIIRLIPGILMMPGRHNALIAVEVAVTLRAARFSESINLVIPSDGSIGYNTDTSGNGYIGIRRSEWRQLGVKQAGKTPTMPTYSGSYFNYEGDWIPWM